MPIGKDSITKRVAKIDATSHTIETKKEEETKEVVTTVAKTSTKKTSTAKTASKNVIANISTETVETVVGHKENKEFKKIKIGCDLPDYLL